MKKTTATASGGLIGTPIGTTGSTLYFGFNRLCRLEDDLGKPFGEILEQLGRSQDLRVLAAATKLGLEEHHAETARTGSAELIEEAGFAVIAKACVDEFHATLGGRAKRA